MMKTRFTLVTLFLVLAAVCVHAQEPLGPPTSELVALRVDGSTHPGDDSVILYHGVWVGSDGDGRVTRRVRVVRRLLTDLAVDHYGDVRVPFDQSHQSLEIHRCTTFMVDGSEIEPLPRAFNQVTADQVASCPDRSDLQEMVISHLGVERGCLTELDYSLSDVNPWRPWLEGRELLGDEAPILRGEITIDTPGELRSATIGNSPSMMHPDATRPERWSYGPVPPIPNEGGLPEAMRIPSLLYSTCPSWESLSGWLVERLGNASNPGEAIAAWADETLASGRPALVDEERIDRIAGLIGERTHPADGDLLSWWLPIRPADRTFETSCGNRLDRAALAAAAFQAFGIDTELSLVPLGPRLVQGVPALVQFKEIWWNAPTRILSVDRAEAAPSLRAGQTEEVVRIRGGATDRQPLPPLRGSSSIVCRIVEEEDGSFRGQTSVRMGGAVCAAFPYGDLPNALQSIADRWVEGAEIAGYEVQMAGPETLSVVYSWTGESFGESAGLGRRRFRIPSAPGVDAASLLSSRLLRRPTRETALMMPMELDEVVHLRLEPQPSTHLILVPKEVGIESSGAALERTVVSDGTVWEIERRLQIGKRRVDPDAYPGLRELLLERLEGVGNDLYLGTIDRSG